MFWIYYLDSIGQQHQIKYQLQEYDNLMELIRDQSFEDWGDCRGRAWCGTCHLKTPEKNVLPIQDQDEIKCLNRLSNKVLNSRLACQIFLDEQIHQMGFQYIGDD